MSGLGVIRVDSAMHPRSPVSPPDNGHTSVAFESIRLRRDLRPPLPSIIIIRPDAPKCKARSRVHSYDHNAFKSSGTSPNFLITLASLKSPVAGSPVRLNATAPTWPSLRDSASARITAALGLKHSVGSPAATPSSLATNGSATQ